MFAVVAEDLCKKYRISVGEASTTLGGRIRRFLRGESGPIYEEIWALRDVNFTVNEGEVFGIIGRNGSGKSTLLKVLAGIARPTRGRAFVRGRVGALLEVGTGFHPDLSGRENVYFNGTLLGLGRKFIKSKLDEIVAFAELERFIDTQFKHYSSGMQSRLAFAVAANLHPEVLILDEVLSVGDIMFQEKSMKRMTELRKSGITILFVSHSLGSVAGICKHAMLLKEGRVMQVGEVNQVVEEYVPKVVTAGEAHVEFEGGKSTQPARYMSATLENADGVRSDQFDMADEIYIRLRYQVRKQLSGLQLGVIIRTHQSDIVQTYDTDAHAFLGQHELGTFEKRVKIPSMFLKEGEYSVRLLLGIPTQNYDDYENVLKFSVNTGSIDATDKSYRRGRAGVVVFPGAWQDVTENSNVLGRRGGDAVPKDAELPAAMRLPQLADYAKMERCVLPFALGGVKPYRSESVNCDCYGLRETVASSGEILTLDTIGSRRCSLMFGDIAFGAGATSDARTLPSALCRYTPRNWLNMGVTSFTLQQCLINFMLYRHKLSDIEHIVLFCGETDLGYYFFAKDFPINHGVFAGMNRFMTEMNSNLFDKSGKMVNGFEGVFQSVHDHHADRNVLLDQLRHTLENWKLLSSDLGARLTFVMQPHTSWLRRELSREERGSLDYRLENWPFFQAEQDFLARARDWYFPALQSICSDIGVEFLNLNDVFEEEQTGQPAWIFLDHVNMTDDGLDFAARTMAGRLKLADTFQ
jgi:lipopolysaccharide transport system ATP-binding protein